MKISAILPLVSLFLLALSASAQAALAFQGTVQNIFQTQCMKCHATTLINGRLLMLNDSTWVVTNRQYLLDRITPQSPLGPIKNMSSQDMLAIRNFLTSASTTVVFKGIQARDGNEEFSLRASTSSMGWDLRLNLSQPGLVQLDAFDADGKCRSMLKTMAPAGAFSQHVRSLDRPGWQAVELKVNGRPIWVRPYPGSP